MRLLLDTHVLIWSLTSPSRLPNTVQETLVDRAHEVFASAVSTWEISIKTALGKMEVDLSALVKVILDTGWIELPVRIAHTVRLRGMPLIHRDPFDRLLAAQAIEEGMILVTRHAIFPRYGVPTMWQGFSP